VLAEFILIFARSSHRMQLCLFYCCDLINVIVVICLTCGRRNGSAGATVESIRDN